MPVGVYRYETHVHTMEASRCGMTPASLMVKHYAKLGFSGVFITDHFVTGYSRGNISADWKTRIDILCSGYYAAKEAGSHYGMEVFFAWEYPYKGGDFLTIGLNEDFLYRHPELNMFEKYGDFAGYANLIHQHGGFIIQAHPFRSAPYIKQGRAHVQESLVDALEVYNGSHWDPSFDKQAEDRAFKLKMPMLAGSDAHDISMAATAYMTFNHKIHHADDFIRFVKAGEYSLVCESRDNI